MDWQADMLHGAGVVVVCERVPRLSRPPPFRPLAQTRTSRSAAAEKLSSASHPGQASWYRSALGALLTSLHPTPRLPVVPLVYGYRASVVMNSPGLQVV